MKESLIDFISNPSPSAGEKIKVACIGDSITEGSNVLLQMRPFDSYPAQLQKMLGNTYEVHNYGYGGRTIIIETDSPESDESWKLSPVRYDGSPESILMQSNRIPATADGTFYGSVMSWNPDVIVNMLGTNDSKSRHWDRDKFIGDYIRIVDDFI